MLEEALRSGAQPGVLLVRERAKDSLPDGLLERAAQAGAVLYCAPDALFELASDVETPQNVIFLLQAAVLDGRCTGRQSAGAAAGRFTGPGQPWHDFAHRGSVRARCRCIVRGLRRSVCPQGRALDHGGGVPSAMRAAAAARGRRPAARAGLAGLCNRAARGQRAAGAQCRSDRAAVIIGSEGRGVTPQAIEMSDQRVIIPMHGPRGIAQRGRRCGDCDL